MQTQSKLIETITSKGKPAMKGPHKHRTTTSLTRNQPNTQDNQITKCSTASNYFAFPEPFVKDLYKRSCYWKKSMSASHHMDIYPYVDLDKPYYHMDNLILKHPANRPQGQVHIKRVFQFPQGNTEFNYITKSHLCKP